MGGGAVSQSNGLCVFVAIGVVCGKVGIVKLDLSIKCFALLRAHIINKKQ